MPVLRMKASRALAVVLYASTTVVGGVAGGVAGCGTTDGGDHSVTYSTTAKANYEKGLKELKDENYPEALKYFAFVKQKFPFSKFAVLAELRTADTQFDRTHYLEAIDQYKTFGRSHPTHEMVEDGYVGFKICESYYKQMPEEFFMVPPAFEKDQSATKDALREIDSFLERWSNSKYADKARQYRKQAVQSLAASELYVARFYLQRKKYRAVVWRVTGMLKDYGGTTLEPEALLMLGTAHARLREPDAARAAYERLIKEHPATVEAKSAREQLGQLPPPTGKPS
jgi:outer membrane protein assembly factor BamD